MDKRVFLDMNRLARETSWAHAFMADYAVRVLAPVGAGLLVLAGLVALGWWSARRDPDRMPAVVWSGVGALLSLGLAEVLAPALARPRPYEVLRHAEVLVARSSPGSYALPSTHVALASAALCGLLLARRWRLAVLAALAALLLMFAGVYVGTNYPSDVLAGAGLGLVVELVLWPLGAWLLEPVVGSLSGGQLGWLVASGRPARDAARPLVIARQAPQRLPSAKAMDALRLATEAARNAPSASRASPSSVRTTMVNPGGPRQAPGGGP